MDFRTCIDNERIQNNVIVCEDALSPHLELTKKIIELEPSPALLSGVGAIPVAANLFCSRNSMARHLDLPQDTFLPSLARKLKSDPIHIHNSGSIFGEREWPAIDLNDLPILFHYPGDGGKYITSAVWIVNDAQSGRNLSYHRMMVIDGRRGAVRVVENRGMHQAIHHAGGRASVAICLGAPPAVLLAAALSPAASVDEMELAGKLDAITLADCKTIDVQVPANCEIVIEGIFTGESGNEGPFVDITGTWDYIRNQPLLEVTRIASRQNPIYHALVPGRSEHKTLMGMPKELDIFNKVNEVCACLDVNMTAGGCSWLHAVVKIRKEHGDDGLNSLRAAFEAHPSLKYCVVVDEDIDIHATEQVEWAVATRFQADKDLLVMSDMPSSSLDPSAYHIPGKKSRGAKLGLDATIKKSGAERAMFERVRL
ncbi:MAG: UbiD family decarboxylase [Candidatus Zhuqueibacterota bacterium]